MFEQKAIKKLTSLLAVSLLVISVVEPSPSVHADVGDDELIVEVLPGKNAYTVAARNNLQVLGYINDNGHHMYLMRDLSSQSINQTLNNVKNDPDVVQAEFNEGTTIAEAGGPGGRSVANIDGGCGTGTADEEAITRIRAPDAWSISTGAGVIVAVIDTGIELSAGLNTVPGYDFIDRDNDPSEVLGGQVSGHGTAVASLIQSVAPDAQIMPIRAFDQNGYSAAFQLAEAIDYARQHGARVINMSFSFNQEIKLVNNVIDYAYGQGITQVAAAGNEASGQARFPATKSEVVSIAAVDRNDIKASFSNWGNVQASAPGVDLEVDSSSSSCSVVSGTSFAAALASGEAALLEAAGHTKPADDIKNYGYKIDQLSGNSGYSLGRRLDCVAALTQTNPN